MTEDLNEKVELRTERLLLRPFELGDVDDGWHMRRSRTWGSIFAAPAVHAGPRGGVRGAPGACRLVDRPTFAIVFEGHVVGGIGLRIKRQHDIAELGYALAKPQWGKGLTPEAARDVVGWGFERYGLNKVGAYAALRNRQSWRVMEKLGMTREAVLRSHSKLWDEYVDEVYYGVLREEWAPTARVCRNEMD